MPRRVELPDGNKRPGLPLDAGHIVNNSETLLNMYNAFFLGKPVTTKYLQVFGPDLPLKLYEAPLGASATELVSLAGVDVEAEAGKLSIIDGGPYLNEMGIESLGEGDAFVRRTTNGFLVIPKAWRARSTPTSRPGAPRRGSSRSSARSPGSTSRSAGGSSSRPRRSSRWAKRSSTGRRSVSPWTRILHRRMGEHGRHGLLDRGRRRGHLRRRHARGGQEEAEAAKEKRPGRSDEVGFRLGRGFAPRPWRLP